MSAETVLNHKPSPSGLQRVRGALEWRTTRARTRLKEIFSAGWRDNLRCLTELGFVLPPQDSMQNYQRMRFLYDSIMKAKPRRTDGVALEVGCFKCSSTVFIAKASRRIGLGHVYALDLFTGTPSWNYNTDYLVDAKQTIRRYRLNDYVSLVQTNSLDYPWTAPIAALHIDADHAYDAVWADMQKYMPFIVSGGVAVFDDYDSSHPGVTRAVNRLLHEQPDAYDVVGVNHQGEEFGSICLQKR